MVWTSDASLMIAGEWRGRLMLEVRPLKGRKKGRSMLSRLSLKGHFAKFWNVHPPIIWIINPEYQVSLICWSLPTQLSCTWMSLYVQYIVHTGNLYCKYSRLSGLLLKGHAWWAWNIWKTINLVAIWHGDCRLPNAGYSNIHQLGSHRCRPQTDVVFATDEFIRGK